MKILLIDDARTMRMFLGLIVREMGFTVVEAADGVEALEKLATEGEITAALIDIDMPRMNGLEFLAAARKISAYDSVKMMMVTSHTSMDSVVECLTLGAQDYLMKPLTREMVQDKFRVLGLYPQGSEH